MNVELAKAGITIETLKVGEVVYRGTKRALLDAGIVASEGWFPGKRGAGLIEIDEDGCGRRVECSRFKQIEGVVRTISIHRAGRYGFEVWVREPAAPLNPHVEPALPLKESWNDSLGMPACSSDEKECSAEFESEKLAFESLLVAKMSIECARIGRDVTAETLKRWESFKELADEPPSFHSVHIAARLYCSPWCGQRPRPPPGDWRGSCP